jgi:pimeloyl-ACP methyl ester carboxylesterase
MDYGAWIKKHLSQVVIKNEGRTVSLWCTEKSDKPLLLLVHGISGDHVGLVPLAVELSVTHRIVMIDLPGHGFSDAILLPSATVLQDWFTDVLDKVEAKIGPISAICAHSFGCSVVLGEKVLRERKVMLLNPVPSPSGMYASYARMIMDSAHLWAHLYNWRPFVMLRGMTLAKVRTREALRRVRWTGLHSRPSFDQIVFQASLVDIILDGSAYQHTAKNRVALVVCGLYDTTARQRDTLDMEEIFGETKAVFLRGGHLVPIETPDRVAHLIREAMVQ